MGQHVVPAGNEKGVPIEEASDATLEYWSKRISEELEKGTARYPAKDRQLCEAMFAEMARRRGEAPEERQRAPEPRSNGQAPARAAAPLARAPQADVLVTSTRDSHQINVQLTEMRAKYHLVAPATVCGSLPEGCEVAFSLVQVNPKDCYSVGGGKVGLDGTNLKQIGAAAGISWDDQASRRLDDGSDPHYVHYVAVGFVRNFDGSLRKLTGTVEIDMRDGSPQVVAMQARAKNGSNFEAQLRDTRLFILRHAETKAKLRAIADMGIRRSYTPEELQKPFAVARLMWTGRSEDPELRRIFAMKQADAMIGGIAGLYGQQNAPPYAPPQAPAALAPPRAQPCLDPGCAVGSRPALHAPPPVGAVPAHDDAIPTEGEKIGSDPQAAEDAGY